MLYKKGWIGLLLLLSVAGWAATQGEMSITVGKKSMQNSVLRVTYGSPPGGYWGRGIIEFRHLVWDQNFGYTLDTYGCGSRKYDRTGPAKYVQRSLSSTVAEVDIEFNDCVTVKKTERLFAGLPVLEIEYATLRVLWFEDFWDVPDGNPVFSMYGVDREITRDQYRKTYACKPENFGTCFIPKLGSKVDDCVYKEHLIFGVHSSKTGRGIGEVYPRSLGMRDWKIWWYDRSTANYECFPGGCCHKTLSDVKRWIFLYEGGRSGLISLGKQIADAAESGAGMGSLALPTQRQIPVKTARNFYCGKSRAVRHFSVTGQKIDSAPAGISVIRLADGRYRAMVRLDRSGAGYSAEGRRQK
jgi:hypothetical protein